MDGPQLSRGPQIPMPPRWSQAAPGSPRWSQDSTDPFRGPLCHNPVRGLIHPGLSLGEEVGGKGRSRVQGTVGTGWGLTSPPGSPRWLSCSGPRPCTGSGRSPRVCSAEVHSPPRTGSPGGWGPGLSPDSQKAPPTAASPGTSASTPTPTLNRTRPGSVFRLHPGT